MARAGALSRRLLPLVLLTTLAFAGVVAGTLWRQHTARRRALDILESDVSMKGLQFELDGNVARALVECPGLDEALAGRAAYAAWHGELPRAHSLVDGLAESVWTRRAMAWIAFREGSPERARALLEKTPFSEDDEWIAFVSGGPIPAPSRLALEIVSHTDVENMRAWCHEVLSQSVGSDAAQLARRVLARIETVELHDDRANALLLEASLRQEPFDRSVAELARSEVAAIRSGSDVGVAPSVAPSTASHLGFTLGGAFALLDLDLANRARVHAAYDLERYRRFGLGADRRRAVTRLRRALALPDSWLVRREYLALQLPRAMAYELGGDVDDKRALARSLEAHPLTDLRAQWEAARLWLSLGDMAGARRIFDALPRMSGGERLGHLEQDNPGDEMNTALVQLMAEASDRNGARFAFSERSDDPCLPSDEPAARAAVISIALGHPWEARDFLERRAHVPPWSLALAISRDEPVRALALLGRGELSTNSLVTKAFASYFEDDPVILAQKLQGAGLSGDRAQAVAGMIESTRSELKKAGYLDEK